MGLTSFQGIGFWISLRGLFYFRVTPGLVVPSHPLLVQFLGLLSFLCIFLLLSNILVSLLCGAMLGGIFDINRQVFLSLLP